MLYQINVGENLGPQARRELSVTVAQKYDDYQIARLPVLSIRMLPLESVIKQNRDYQGVYVSRRDTYIRCAIVALV